jgi:PAS domain S-box-containing protein
MGEMEKTKEQLVEELSQARKRIAELEAAAVASGRISSLYYGIFENFVESATDSFSIWDSNLNLIYINNANLRYLPAGTKKSDVLGKNIKEMIPSAEKSGHYERYKHVLETGEPLTIEDFKIDPKYGDRYLSIKVFKINDGIGIISSDVTERKRMEQALQGSQQRLSVLIDNAPDVIFTYDINGRFISGNKRAEDLMGYSQEELLGKTFAESGIFTPESLAKAVQRIESYKHGKPSEPTPYELISRDGSHIFVEVRGVPIVQGNTVEVIAIARDITERKKIEKQLNDYKQNLEKMVEERTAELASAYEELRESEERLRSFFENVPDILFAHNMEGQFTDINKKGLELSGYSRDEIVGKNILETGILPLDQIEGVVAGIKGIEEGKSGYPYEVQLMKKDGSRIAVEAVSFPIKRKGVLEVMGIARDITERKHMENALKNSEEKLRTMFASMADGVVVTDLEGIFKDANEALLRMFGYSKKEDVMGINGFAFIAEKDRNLAMNDMTQLFSDGLVTGRSWTFKHRSGGEFQAELSTALLKDAKGNPTDILVVMRDITKRKQIEEALRESEQKLRLMFEAIKEGIFVIDLDGKVAEVNRGVEKITGYRRKQLLGQSGLDYMFPVFKDDAIGMLQKVISRGGTQKEVVVPMKTATGKVIEVEANSSVLRDFSGNPIGLIGVVRDISERKKAEVKLKESKEELRFYLNQITKAQEEERKRIARELHDDTIQELIALSRQLDDLIDKKIMPDEDRRGSRKKIEEAQEKVTSILQNVRRFTRDLRPSILDDLGLVPALEWLTSDMSARFKIPIDISIIGNEKNIAPDAALAMFRVAQESLRNAGSHSKALQIQLNLKFTSKAVTLSIIDNGKGFTPPKQISSLTKHGKLGVAGMYERAQLIGATLSIKSRRNEGTTISLEVPIK